MWEIAALENGWGGEKTPATHHTRENMQHWYKNHATKAAAQEQLPCNLFSPLSVPHKGLLGLPSSSSTGHVLAVSKQDSHVTGDLWQGQGSIRAHNCTSVAAGQRSAKRKGSHTPCLVKQSLSWPKNRGLSFMVPILIFPASRRAGKDS